MDILPDFTQNPFFQLWWNTRPQGVRDFLSGLFQQGQGGQGQGGAGGQESGWGDTQVPVKPTVNDLASAAYSDWLKEQEVNEENRQRREEVARGYGEAVQDIAGGGQRDLEQAWNTGVDVSGQHLDWVGGIMNNLRSYNEDRRKDNLAAADDARGRSDEALQQSEWRINEARNRAEWALSEAGNFAEWQIGDWLHEANAELGKIDEAIQKGWDVGERALSEFNDRMAERMSAWQTGYMRQHRAMKDRMAAELSAQGFRPEEIQNHLQKMDLEASDVVAGQTAQFMVQQEEARRQIRQHYDTIALQNQSNMMGLRTQLRSVEANMRTSIAQVKAGLAEARTGLETWYGTSMKDLGELRMRNQYAWGNMVQQANNVATEIQKAAGAIESEAIVSRMNNLTQMTGWKMQFGTALRQLEFSGATGMAGMLSENDKIFVPLLGHMLGLFSIGLGLEDREQLGEIGAIGLQASIGNYMYGMGANLRGSIPVK